MPCVPFAPWMRGASALALIREAEGPKRSVAPLTYYAAVLRAHERLSKEVWSAEAWVELARTKLLAGDLPEAEMALKQAGMIGTPDPEAACMLAEILLETDRAERAHGLLARSVEGRPHVARPHYLLGLARRELGLEGEADAYRAALDIDPDFAPAWHRLGNYLSLRKQWAESVAAYREVLRIVPDDCGALCGLAVALHRGGDRDGALECVSRLREVGARAEAELLEACLEPAKPVPEGVRLREYPRRARPEGEKP